ncbi:MAG TPA: type II and III secretion system protein [Chthoniobacterales bacterium]|nr:type II and III secretion system protein [Chthoniobacterales bacterium]
MKTNPPRSENAVVVARVLTRRSGFAAEDRPPLHRSVLAKSYFVAAVSLSIFCTTNLAQNVDNVAQREIQRRQSAIPQGEAALAQGKAAMKAKNYSLAHEEFKTAVRYLPDAVVSGKAHDEAVEGFCKSGVILAEARIAQADYVGAEAILSEILSDRYDPNCRPARELMAHLHQPGYFNKTMGPKFIAKVEEVKQLLTDADGYYQSGRYDLAFKKYDQVLVRDPYNTAARKGQEKINNTKYQYGEEAYNETRSRQLWEVEKGWEEPVHQYGAAGEPVAISTQRDLSGTARIKNKLNTIIIPRIEFHNTSLREAVEVLRQQAVENDRTTEGQRGINIVLRLVPIGQVAPPLAPVEPAAPPASATSPAPGAAAPPTAPATTPVAARPVTAPAVVPTSAVPPASINLDVSQMPLSDALHYIADQAGLRVKIEPHAILLIPRSEQSGDLITRTYIVPPEFFGGPLDIGYILGTGAGSATASGGAQGGQAVTPPIVAKDEIEKNAASFQSSVGSGGAASTLAAQGTITTRQQLTSSRQLVGRADATTFLRSMGVDFSPPGSSATFLPQTSTLIVRNTQDNLDMVDALVDEANRSRPKQVEIESKFVEITQNNLKELGFDWLLGPFKVGSQGAFGSGGTSGNGTAVNAANYPFVDPVTGQPIGQNPVTAGNRSGNAAISANAIDALLFPSLGSTAVAPGIFSLAGVFTDPQFQVVIRALNQKKGVDLLSAPKVTTKSGQRAVIEIVREFRYPTTYTAPQVPSVASTVVGGSNPPVVVTPTTPQTFETRNTGVTLEVEPVVGADGQTIDLNLVPQDVEFEGFINYGSPINAVGINTVLGTGGTSLLTTSTPVLLTQNVINQPIFSTRKVTTSVSVYDGSTVILGGLMREDVQKTEDKVPIIGDIPLVGRLFRTNVDQHIKRNLVIFVTARLVTPGGEPIHSAEEEEEGLLQPPLLPEIPAYKK